MSATDSEHHDDVWQGMVAAVACLLLALLLLMSILALSVVQMEGVDPDKPSLTLGQPSPTLPSTRQAQWLLKFSPLDVALEDAQRKQLVNDFKPNLFQSGLNWRLWVNVPEGEALLERKAYLRMLSVRSLLLDAGVLPSQINLQIVQSSSTSSTITADPTQVFVMRVSRRDSHGSP